MKTIIVSVTNDLSTDQRVYKVCNTLHLNGYKVILIGRFLKNSLPIDRPYKTKRLSLFFNKGFLFYLEFNFRLFFVLLFLKKDILLSNDLDTLLPNYFVSKLLRKKMVFDSHELFSEIPELETKPKVKKVWQIIENTIIPKLKNCYTVCNSIANYFNQKYATSFKVIRNVPLFQKKPSYHSFPFNTENKEIILYQGSVNLGRGLALMIDTLQFLHNHLLVIVGSGDVIDELKQAVKHKNLEHKIYFLGRIIPKELQKLTPLADIGISVEEDLGLNYRFALPNKIFDYIQAGVPILVSDLPEMKRIVLNYEVGEIVKQRTPKDLANQIIEMSNKNFSISLQKAKKELIWEKEEKKLLEIFENLK